MSQKVKLNLPESLSRTRFRNNREEIWDDIRGKWLVLTPEEWVRRQMIGYLIRYKGALPMLIKQEQRLTLHGTSRRADIVVYDTAAKPQMIVECKAPQVKLTQEVLEQVIRYNIVLKVPYILITNGLEHYCYQYNESEKQLWALKEIPDLG